MIKTSTRHLHPQGVGPTCLGACLVSTLLYTITTVLLVTDGRSGDHGEHLASTLLYLKLFDVRIILNFNSWLWIIFTF